MAWQRVQLEIDQRQIDRTEVLLEALGAVSISLSDGGDTPVLEPLPGETPTWPRTRLTALFDMDTDAVVLSAQLAALPTLNNLDISPLEDEDWQSAWRQYARPLQFGRLRIVPWESGMGPTGGAQVLLEPGLAFGTGSHPTTAMCLHWLQTLNLQDKEVLDYGCGSGILAIASLRLGARSATGTDIDPQALQSTMDNAQRNHCADQLTVADPSAWQPAGQYDVLVANILSGPLIELSPRLQQLTKPGAAVALTGILASQADAVCSVYSNWVSLAVSAQIEEWVLLAGQISDQVHLNVHPMS